MKIVYVVLLLLFIPIVTAVYTTPSYYVFFDEVTSGLNNQNASDINISYAEGQVFAFSLNTSNLNCEIGLYYVGNYTINNSVSPIIVTTCTPRVEYIIIKRNCIFNICF